MFRKISLFLVLFTAAVLGAAPVAKTQAKTPAYVAPALSDHLRWVNLKNL